MFTNGISEMAHRLRIWLLLMLMASVIFVPGLDGDFLFDDGPNILLNKALQIPSLNDRYLREAAYSYEGGHALGRPLPMLTLALNAYWGGLDPFGFKLTNLAIHFVNALLVLCFLLTIQRKIPGLAECYQEKRLYTLAPYVVSALWFILPINLSPVLYVIQRMTSLSSLFTLLALILFLEFRFALAFSKYRIAILHAILLFFSAILAIVSKEIAIMLPVYIFLIEYCLIGSRLTGTNLNVSVKVLSILGLLLPALLFLFRFYSNPGWLEESYAVRDFTLAERLLTEARVLWFYFIQTLLPQNQSLGLYHDDWMHYFRPQSGIFEIVLWLLWIGFVIAAYFCRRTNPFLYFSLLLFLASHFLESTIIGLELVHEHRNYFGSFAVVLIFFSMLMKWQFDMSQQKYIYAIGAIYAVLLGFVLSFRVTVWSDLAEHAKHEVVNHPYSHRANYQYGRVIVMTAQKTGDQKLLPEAIDYLEKCATMDERDVLCLGGLIYIEGHFGLSGHEALIQLLDRMLYRLGQQKIHHSAHTVFQITSGQLPESMAADFVGKAFSAVFNNKKVSDAHKAIWATSYASFSYGMGDIEQAKQFHSLAEKLSGGSKDTMLANAIFRLNIGEYDVARDILNRLEHTFYAFRNPEVGYYIQQLNNTGGE